MLLTILTYFLWLLSATLSLGIALQLRVLLLSDLPVLVFRVDPWALGAIDKFGTVVLGLLWLIYVVATEPYFRRLLDHDLTAQAIVRLFLIEVGLMAGVTGLRLLI